MSNPTATTLAANRRSDPPSPIGCHVDLRGVLEKGRPALMRAIPELVDRSRQPHHPTDPGVKEGPAS